MLLLLATAGVLHSPIEREAFEEAKHSATRNPTCLPSAHSKPERIIHGVNRTTIMMPEFIFVDASPSKSLRSALRRAVEAGCTQRWPTLRTGGASRATRVRISTCTTTNLGRDANSYDVDLPLESCVAAARRGGRRGAAAAAESNANRRRVATFPRFRPTSSPAASTAPFAGFR